MVDLEKLEEMLDEALENETVETMTEWLREQESDDYHLLTQKYFVKSKTCRNFAARNRNVKSL